MRAKIVKVTDKGQISIPTTIRDAIKIRRGDELLLLEDGENILIQKVKKSRFKDLLKHAENVAKKLWSNKEDDRWDKI
tara:strand:+ start:71250 stop:71483 length:234 start_codon:yes stop_codon:yes gene_type:complete